MKQLGRVACWSACSYRVEILYVAIMGFFGVVWCLLACFVPVRSTPRHFVFVVSCWSLIMGGRTNYSWMACVRIYAGWGIGDPTGVDCLWTRRLAATSRTSAWRSLIPHLVINPSTMAARTSSSLWVLLPNFSPCRWTQRWWWSSQPIGRSWSEELEFTTESWIRDCCGWIEPAGM